MCIFGAQNSAWDRRDDMIHKQGRLIKAFVPLGYVAEKEATHYLPVSEKVTLKIRTSRNYL